MRRFATSLLLLPALYQAEILADKVCGPVSVAAPSGGPFQNEIETEVCNQVNAQFQTGNFAGILTQMAKAYSLAAAGRVADYASNMTVFSLGGGMTVALSNITPPLNTSELDRLKQRLSSVTVPDFGSGFSGTATLGISLKTTSLRARGWFDPKDLNFYFSFFILPTLSYSGYSINSLSGSFYVQYKLLRMRRVPLSLVTWGGIDIGLGYTYAANRLAVASSEKLASISFVNNGKNILYEPTGSVTLEYKTQVIPLELSTNFSLLHFLSFVIGGAADFHIQTEAAIAATISGTVKVDGVGTAGDYARFSATETSRGDTMALRFFAGPQFNIWKIRLFTLVHATNRNSYALTLGARFTW